MADVQRLEIDHEVTCPICGALSARSTFDARMEMADLPTAGKRWNWLPTPQPPQPPLVGGLDTVTFHVIWTAINAWLDCGHQVIRDGALVQDWRPLDEDVSTHRKTGLTAHSDGRMCGYHDRLEAWTFGGTKECLRTHPNPHRWPRSGDPSHGVTEPPC